MRDPVLERATFAARHDFDMLPRSAEIDARPARHSELSAVADMANRLIPGVQITEPDLERYFIFDPESIFTFSRKQKLLGAVAFLYLNDQGHDALILDGVNLTHPDFGLLAGRHNKVSAIYVWGITGQGRAMGGLGNMSRHLSGKRFASANIYAQASSADGRKLMIALGFEPMPSYQRDLWRYERPWNRYRPNAPTSNAPASVLPTHSTSDWNRPGVLDISSGRLATEPLRQM
jgi:hypothetical protein